MSGGPTKVEISGINYDSRKSKPGALFFAIKGLQSDGHRYISAAIDKGVSAVVQEEPLQNNGMGIVRIQVENSRRAMARAAANFYRHPSRNLFLYGITGTDGKTSTCHILHEILRGRERSGLLGTVGHKIGGRTVEAVRTTPEAPDINRILREMVDCGAVSAVAEVSSHALSLHRVDGLDFDIAIFTNLAQDHLDFHEDMEDYFQAKLKLFKTLSPEKFAVINSDDPWGQRIPCETEGKVFGFCEYGKSAFKRNVGLRFHLLQQNIAGSLLNLKWETGEITVRTRLMGKPGAYNCAAAASAAVCAGYSPEEIAAGLENFKEVRGRFQRIDCGDFIALVDYAHTPQALERLLQTVVPLTNGTVRLVFGCGGDRDRTKRSLMGKAAESSGADRIYLTNDNPRSEDPMAIIEDILQGIEDKSKIAIIPDRRAAIYTALNESGPGDVSIFAGKGHELRQEINGVFHRFNDSEVITEWLDEAV